LGPAQNNYGLISSGGVGGYGIYINFDATTPKYFGSGGSGGVPNTPNTGTTLPNLGVGGAGTGATLNSFANGLPGGSGIVILKWYT
jgi:hypothetical protein